ncbi:MAG: tripartite tricarboxylate transporter TctB family protein [Thiolinea sp.]
MESRPSTHNAELLFTAFLLLGSLLLLSQLGNQLSYAAGQPFFKQPGLWTLIGLLTLLLGSLLHLWNLWRTRDAASSGPGSELLAWLRGLEFLGWFLAYVWLVPLLGYLPATLLFGLVLTLRLGYRQRHLLLGSVLVSLTTVLVFKSFLQAKIPGGLLYDYLPQGLRNFMTIYF